MKEGTHSSAHRKDKAVREEHVDSQEVQKQGARIFGIKSPSKIRDTKIEKAVFVFMHRGVSQ